MRARLRRLLIASVWLASPALLPAFAQSESPPVAVSPVEDFNKRYQDVKKHFEALGGKIKLGAKDIESLTSAEAARREIAAMQALIAETLGMVSSNGDVAALGQKALEFARAKQRQFENDTKFTPEERQFLQKEWRRISSETENATQDLSRAREEFSELLRMVQTRGDYIGELQALNSAQKMLEVIKSLAAEIRSASEAMKSLIQSATPPGAGS